ncbi:MAG: flagellar motor switch protein FliN, partial [Acetatifactor muris]|nr:flagellar motor switch protein FliN [Acetatifactor muris]
MGMSPQGMNPQGMAPQGMMPQPDMSMGMSPQGMNPQGMNPQMGMMPQMGMPMMGMNPQMGMMPQMGMPMMGMAPMGTGPQNIMQNVNVQPAQFQSFGGDGRPIQGQENIGLIMDVPLEVTVELGRTTRSISEILNFAPGTIIELDRIAGEPIDVLVNGKFVARGEVVVIEESFSVRVTEIIK